MATPASRRTLGSLPDDPTERLTVLERLWKSAMDTGVVRALPCDDDDHEHERSISEYPNEMGCCEGAGWFWQFGDAERDRYKDALVRAARLCEGRDTAMVLQVLREALDA